MKKILSKLVNFLYKKNTEHTYSIYFLRLLSYGLTWSYWFFVFFDREKRINFHERKNRLWKTYLKKRNVEFNNKFLNKDRYNFNGIFLPRTSNIDSLRQVYGDVLFIYTEKNDNYNYKIVDMAEKRSDEGPFCYLGPNHENITVSKGDVVIDAGAWIGDFSA
jgi:hypothetical protein